jgi:hypothetical protein
MTSFKIVLILVLFLGFTLTVGCSSPYSNCKGGLKECNGTCYDPNMENCVNGIVVINCGGNNCLRGQNCCNGTCINENQHCCGPTSAIFLGNRVGEYYSDGTVCPPGTDYLCGGIFINTTTNGCCNHKVYNKSTFSCCNKTIFEGNIVKCGDKCCPVGNECCNDRDRGPTCYDPEKYCCNIVIGNYTPDCFR